MTAPETTAALERLIDALKDRMRHASYPLEDGTMFRGPITVYHGEFVALRTLLALASQPPTDGGWEPIETAPKDGTEVMGYLPVAKKARVVVWRLHWDQWQTVPGYNAAKPTHWRPIPVPPDQGEG